MNAQLHPATRRRGSLLLADISGYTGFLGGVAEAHTDLIIEADQPPPAYAVLSHLLDTMVAAIDPPFRLVKFEGDAVFALAEDGSLDGADVLETLRRCYARFREELALAGSQWTCSCNACARIGDLDLKFILHTGEFVAQSIAGREELLGHDVNLAHRLLKNHARELVGPVAYALITDAAAQRLGVPTEGMTATVEEYADTTAVPVHLLVLGETPAPV